jgi:hypothetical protein
VLDDVVAVVFLLLLTVESKRMVPFMDTTNAVDTITCLVSLVLLFVAAM